MQHVLPQQTAGSIRFPSFTVGKDLPVLLSRPAFSLSQHELQSHVTIAVIVQGLNNPQRKGPMGRLQ